MSESNLTESNLSTLPLPDSVAELIQSRRTIHDFIPGRKPDSDIIRQGLDVARWSPNHHLTEPWHFYWLGPETARAIAELNARQVTASRGAEAGQTKLQRWLAIPGWLVVTCENSADPVRAKEDYAACCCAIQNFMLYLWSHQIGVKWTTGAVTRSDEFYDLIWVDPECETVVGMLWYGYAAEVPQLQRQALESVLVELP